MSADSLSAASRLIEHTTNAYADRVDWEWTARLYAFIEGCEAGASPQLEHSET